MFVHVSTKLRLKRTKKKERRYSLANNDESCEKLGKLIAVWKLNECAIHRYLEHSYCETEGGSFSTENGTQLCISFPKFKKHFLRSTVRMNRTLLLYVIHSTSNDNTRTRLHFSRQDAKLYIARPGCRVTIELEKR